MKISCHISRSQMYVFPSGHLKFYTIPKGGYRLICVSCTETFKESLSSCLFSLLTQATGKEFSRIARLFQELQLQKPLCTQFQYFCKVSGTKQILCGICEIFLFHFFIQYNIKILRSVFKRCTVYGGFGGESKREWSYKFLEMMLPSDCNIVVDYYYPCFLSSMLQKEKYYLNQDLHLKNLQRPRTGA